MASRSFVAVCALLALGLNFAAAESTPATTAAVTEMPAAVTSTFAPAPVPMDTSASDTLALMVTDLTRSMADVYSLLQSELRTLTQQMQAFSSILGDVKTAVAVLQAKRPDPPQQMVPPPMPMPYMPPMGFAPQFAPAMIAPTPPMGFPANLLSQLQMQMPQMPQMPQQLPQQPPAPPQQQSPPAQPQPPAQQNQASQQQSNQQDLLMTMLAGMTGSMPPVVPPMPNAPPGLDGPAGMLQAMMGAGAGAGGSPNPAAAMAAAMAAGGGAAGPAGPGGPGRRRDPAEMEGADMLMLMSMSGMFA